MEKKLCTIPEGFACSAFARGPVNWDALVLVRPDPDRECFEILTRHEFRPRSRAHLEAWRRKTAVSAVSLELVRGRGRETRTETLSGAAGIGGFRVGGSRGTVAAWSERDARGGSRLRLFRRGRTKTVFECPGVLGEVDFAGTGDDFRLYSGLASGGRETCLELDSRGNETGRFEGRNPRCLESAGRRLGVLFEKPAPGGRLGLHLRLFREGKASEHEVPPLMGQNTRPSATVDPSSGEILVAFEAYHPWGANEFQGQHREIGLLAFDPARRTWSPGPGTANGFFPARPLAFLDKLSAMNLVPVQPRLVPRPGEPALAWLQFRAAGEKGFGWDLLYSGFDRRRWLEPVRLGRFLAMPDTGWALFSSGRDCLCFVPACDYEPQRTFAEIERGVPARGSRGLRNQRVEIFRADPGSARPPEPPPARLLEFYRVPPPVSDIAPEPPDPTGGTGEELAWADLHAHSAYSKCMSANDGFPDEVLRFQREVLGCRVLCLTEHVEYLNFAEFSHVLDRLEAAAGDGCLPLYGVEWGCAPAHHTNFYCADRAVFNRLRAVLLEEKSLAGVFARLRSGFSLDTVAVHRHMHGISRGDHGVSGTRFAAGYDPEIENAMEAVQTRGNMLWLGAWAQQFPANFLNAGARVGLVGGSDHSRGRGPNRFCLTGIFLPEMSPRGLMAALRGRRTIAAANGKVAIRARLGQALPGQETVNSGPPSWRVSAASARPLRRACLVRNGIFLDWLELSGLRAEFELADPDPPAGDNWYSVTVEADSAWARPAAMAHASPFFVRQR